MALNVFGVLFLISLFVVGPTKYLNFYSSAVLTNSAEDQTMEVRHIVLNHTTYSGLNSIEFANDLLKNLPDIRYALADTNTIIYDVQETWNYGGDCKANSIMFAAMMHSMGYDAYVDCSLDHHHCVTKIPQYKGPSSPSTMYAIVDLTGNWIGIYDNEVDHWSDPYNTRNAIKYYKDEN